MNRDDVMRATQEHVREVQNGIKQIINNLLDRAIIHDKTKFDPEQWNAFAESTPKLADLKYGSKEYKDALKELGPALKLHYKLEKHHIDHHPNGIKDMTLFDLLEMLADIRAAQKRHIPNGTWENSFTVMKEKYDIPKDLEKILRNSVEELKWS